MRSRIDLNVGVMGIVTLYCLRPDGTERPGSRRVMKNRVVDAGLDSLMGSSTTGQLDALTQWCGVGDNATAVADGQTALQNPIKLDGVNFRTQTTFTGDLTTLAGGVAPDYYVGRSRVRKFNAATSNLIVRELGFFTASSAGTMWNRLVITPDYSVLTGEELVVQLENRFYVPNADVTGSVVISAINYSYTIRALNAQATGIWGSVTFLTDWTRAANAGCSGTAGLVAQTAGGPATTDPASATPAAYVNGTFYRDVEYVWDPATFTSTIRWLKFWNGRLQMNMNDVIPKDGANRLRLTFRHQFTRL